MHKATLKDFFLLITLAAIWGSAFFNIKIASDTYTPITLAFGRIFFAALVFANDDFREGSISIFGISTDQFEGLGK